MIKTVAQLILTLFFAWTFALQAKAAGMCVELFEPKGNRHEQYRSVFDDFIEKLEKLPTIKGVPHPRSNIQNNMNALGLVQLTLTQHFPLLKDTGNLLSRVKQSPHLNFDKLFDKISREVLETIQKKWGLQKPLEIFAAIDALKDLNEINDLIEREVRMDEERVKQEEKKKIEEKKKSEEEKKKVEDKDEQDKKDESSDKEDQDKDDKPSESGGKTDKEGSKKEKKPKPKLQEEDKDEYKSENKDLQSDPDGENQPAYNYFTTAPVKMKVMRKNIYEVFPDSNWSKNRQLRVNIQQKLDPQNFDRKNAEILFIENDHKAKSLVLPIMYDYEPVLGNYPGGFSVISKGYGEYQAVPTTGAVLPERINIWLIKSKTEHHKKSQLDGLTKKSGIALNQWPDHVRQGLQIAKKAGSNDPYNQVLSLSKWFQKDGPYLYNSRTKKKSAEFDEKNQEIQSRLGSAPDAVVYAEAKMFNCDNAALIGATLVRDHLNLPTRLASGVTVTGQFHDKKNNIQYNVVDLNDPHHAWIEVLINNMWVPFDFTPMANSPDSDGAPKKEKLKKPNDPLKDRELKPEEKDKKEDKKEKSEDKSDGEKSDQQENESENDQSVAPAESSADGKGSSGNQGYMNLTERISGNEQTEQNTKAKTADELKAIEDKELAEAKERQEARLKDQAEADAKVQAEKNKTNLDSKDKNNEINSDRVSKIKTGQNEDFLKLPKNYDSPMGAYFQNALRDTFKFFTTKGPVAAAKNFFSDLINKVNLLNHYKAKGNLELNTTFEPFFLDNDKPIAELLAQAKTEFYSNPTLSYNKLKLIANFMTRYELTGEASAEQIEFKKRINSILERMSRYRDENSSQHEMVMNFFKQLPGQVIRSIMTDKYKNAAKIGTMDQKVLFKELVNGQWAGAYQASLINKHFNFFLNAEKEYRTRRVQSIIRSYIREKKSQGLVLSELKDVAHFERWLLDPEVNEDAAMTLLSKLLKGEQHMMANRQMINMAGRGTPIEKKHTNVFFDVSGSMGGPKARVQASALAAIVDRALSEKDPFGNPIHTVMLFPFGSKVGEGIEISSVEQARHQVLGLLMNPTRSDEGTIFQPCFDKHFEMIHKYAVQDFKSSDKFKHLALKKANMVLITDGGGNVDLPKVLLDLQNLPPSVEMFFNLVTLEGKNEDLESIVKATNSARSKSMITSISESQMADFVKESANPYVNPNAFVYDTKKGAISSDIANDLSTLRMPSFEDEKTMAYVGKAKAEIKENRHIEAHENHLVYREISQLTDIFLNGALDNKVKQIILGKILKNYPRWTGHQLNALSLLEEELLKKLVEAADK
jgi:hypothetical protein